MKTEIYRQLKNSTLMKRAFEKAREQLSAKCEALTQKQRRWLLVSLAATYLILTAIVVIPVFYGENREEHPDSDRPVKTDCCQDTVQARTQNGAGYGQGH